MAKLKYVDARPISIPSLKISLPKDDNIIEVDEKLKNSLLKRKNGNSPCFVEVKKERKTKDKDGGKEE